MSRMCDGMFLILDTARHMGLEPDDDEIRDHLAECDICSEV